MLSVLISLNLFLLLLPQISLNFLLIGREHHNEFFFVLHLFCDPQIFLSDGGLSTDGLYHPTFSSFSLHIAR
jgi:hypothetical protein